VEVDAESAPVAEPAFELQRNVVIYPMWRTAPPRWEWNDSAIPRFGPAFQPTPPPFEAVVGQLSLGTVAVEGRSAAPISSMRSALRRSSRDAPAALPRAAWVSPTAN
jgi:hypothetical protein